MSTLNVTNLAGPSNTGTAATLSSINGGPISGTRNRIINGDMRIDQRNTAVTASAYTVDRWALSAVQNSKVTVQKSASVVPSGFSASLGVTSSSAYSVLAGDFFVLSQPIEGLTVDDLAWGTAIAKAVTISFWVRSSLTGTFGGSLMNDGANRCYPFTYSISAANTWEYKTVAVPGDTTGTWKTDNGVGIYVSFSLGAGSSHSGPANTWAATNYRSATGATSVVSTNGATFYLTGVQLEAGNIATPFERRSYGHELQLCQRYAYVMRTYSAGEAYFRFPTGYTAGTGSTVTNIHYPVEMRSTPSLAANINWQEIINNSPTPPTGTSVALSVDAGNRSYGLIVFTPSSGAFTGFGALSCVRVNNSTTWSLTFSSEL
jgi:hypothetical protein